MRLSKRPPFPARARQTMSTNKSNKIDKEIDGGWPTIHLVRRRNSEINLGGCRATAAQKWRHQTKERRTTHSLLKCTVVLRRAMFRLHSTHAGWSCPVCSPARLCGGSALRHRPAIRRMQSTAVNSSPKLNVGLVS